MIVQIVSGGVVTNIISVDESADLVEDGAAFMLRDHRIEAPENSKFTILPDAGIGWTVSNGVATPPPVIEPLQTADTLSAYASSVRWRKENGGIDVGGIRIPTDDRSKTMIGRAARTSSSVASTPFIVSGVNYGSVTKAQFEVMDAAIDVHVATTFQTLAAVLAQIADGTITTTSQVDAAFA